MDSHDTEANKFGKRVPVEERGFSSNLEVQDHRNLNESEVASKNESSYSNLGVNLLPARAFSGLHIDLLMDLGIGRLTCGWA